MEILNKLKSFVVSEDPQVIKNNKYIVDNFKKCFGYNGLDRGLKYVDMVKMLNKVKWTKPTQ